MRWNTICFDLDNTLFSHEDAFEQAVKHTFYTMYQTGSTGNPFAEVDAKDWFRTFKYHSDLLWAYYEQNNWTHDEYRKKRFDETMKAFSLPYARGDAEQFHEQYEKVVADFCVPFEGVYELLDRLLKEGLRLGIITNGRTKTQRKKWQKLQLDSFIPESHLIVSEEAAVEKPEREMFDYALQQLQGETAGSLFIGDSWELDVQGAIHAGWDAVFLNTRGEERTTSDAPAAEHKSFQETARFLLQSLRLKG
ncbi:HAD family hydrolase [Salibacterium halotolerans]|uniref:Putative hydrolase of the HAD superfamily n=1 Tax=Salibacterium halotolerans TaxID=1884432 RepID=A0A1I5NJV0_9BACI|nr:HAD-IA family hydrolase [Salibacterium halotolerans]SFP22073.1 putative hydrolase of the HAD superfamily [Salibacterium halotolerans]